MVAIARQPGLEPVLSKGRLNGNGSRSPSTHSESRNTIKIPHQRKHIGVNRQQSDRELAKRLDAIVSSVFRGEPKPTDYEDIRASCNRKKRNLIHLTLDELLYDEDANSPDPIPPEVLQFLEELVLHEPGLFTNEDSSGLVPLYMVSAQKPAVLFAILRLLIPLNVEKAIQVDCADNSARCPLEDVHPGRRKQCSRTLSTKKPNDANGIDQSEGSSLHMTAWTEAPDQTADTGCLHRVVKVEEVLKNNKRLREVLEKGLCQSKRSCLHDILDEQHLDPLIGTAEILARELPLLLAVSENGALETRDQEGYTPLHRAIKLFDKDNIDYGRLYSIIETLVQWYPSAIYSPVFSLNQNDNGRTALSLLRTVKCPNEDPRAQFIERTENLLKEACIGSSEKTADAKKQFLYSGQVRSVRHICLNLVAESSLSSLLDKTYIRTIRDRSGMEFESVLDFVKLPYWNPKNEPVSQDGASPDGGPCNPYLGIFEWLWDRKVTKLFTVEVDDTGAQPHTNAAIRWALRGNPEGSQDFHVEVFKWKKFDICCDTILRAAPESREVHLYSSGNVAVLRGWASGSELGKLKNLRKLIIEIHPSNPADEADCEAYQDELKRSIKSNCPSLEPDHPDIQFKDSRKVAGRESAVDSGVVQTNANRQADTRLNPEQWIQELQTFKSFVWGLVKRSDGPSIKVALLDDGVNLALQWAVDMGVDIISMSWSLPLKSEGEDETRLRTLIQTIVQNGNILLFASLLDGGSTVSTPFFAPVGLPGVIKISSATVYGAIAEQNRLEEPDFLLPGEDIPVDGQKEPVSGSSYATAYAAGLAALVLYSFKALLKIETDSGDDDDTVRAIDNRLQKAKHSEGMKSIFRVLSNKLATSSDKKLFLRPSLTLNQDYGDSLDEKRKQMGKLLEVLLPEYALTALKSALHG
ncbi:hypothetical protein BDV59DRAFT_201804 [Aspergillus ambiguus]|uniref:uncharacterized protein n=1 Tax=Aspergillus ambiguus TaxID=176160 RepID=UPI003CCCD86E